MVAKKVSAPLTAEQREKGNVGSGGYVYYGFEDTKFLEVSGGQVVGVIRLPDDPNRPWTFEQKKTTWMMLDSFAFMLAVTFGMFWSTRKPK